MLIRDQKSIIKKTNGQEDKGFSIGVKYIVYIIKTTSFSYFYERLFVPGFIHL